MSDIPSAARVVGEKTPGSSLAPWHPVAWDPVLAVGRTRVKLCVKIIKGTTLRKQGRMGQWVSRAGVTSLSCLLHGSGD